MKGNKKRDTKPELALRSALHRAGYRFRVDFPIRVPGRRPIRVDLVFTNRRVAVFVDGCFWHRCPEHCTVPRANGSYWTEKLTRNADRDRETDAALTAAGWSVIRVWEHDEIGIAVTEVARLLSRRTNNLGP